MSKVWTTRTSVAVAVAGALLLAACGDDGGTVEDLGIPEPTARSQITVQTDHDAGHGAGAAVTCTPHGTSLSISANAGKFDKDCLAAPANQAFTIAFNNRDGEAYNVAIYPSHTEVNRPLFKGELVKGPTTVTYNVGPLAPGTYAFHSDVKSEQLGHGTFIVK